MRLNSRHVDCFQAVMTLGTVTAAADMLNTSQPAVSRSIQQMEAAIGLTLFERDKGRLLPTAQALALYSEVKKSFVGLENIRRVAANLRSFQSGSISIVCAPAFSQGFIAEVASRFVEKYRSVSLTIETEMSPTIAEWMSAQRFDLGLAAYVVAPAATEVELFADPSEVCVFPAYHPLAARHIIHPQDLKGTRFIFLGGNDPYRYRLDKVFERAGINRDLVIETRNSATACAMVLKGAGVAIVNPFTALDYVESGLVLRRFSERLPFTTTLLRATLRPASPIVDLFIGQMLETRDRALAAAEAALSS